MPTREIMTIEELQKELEAEKSKAKALEASKQRLEEESKTFKTRAQEAEAKISEAEKAKLEESGELEKLLQKEREEKAALSRTLESRTKSVLSEKLRAEVARHATDAHDVDMILKVGEHKDLLSINEEDLSVTGAEEFVSKARETHTYLFKKKKIDGHDDEDPEPSKKAIEEKYYAELDACTNRNQLDAVKKKYGRS